MDIRLPPTDWKCERKWHAEADASCHSRLEHLAVLNDMSRGSDVFVQTDRAFAADLRAFENVVATRFTDEIAGGFPVGITPVDIQWWRLKHGWQLVRQYEETCHHEYEFVVKTRTDAAVIGSRPFRNLYDEIIKSKYDVAATAFMMSDRIFAASHDNMAKIAALHGDPYFAGLVGTCGTCDTLNVALRKAQATPLLVNVPHYSAKQRLPQCARGCFLEAAGGKQVCPLYQADKEGLRTGVSKNLFDEWKNASVRPGANYSCVIAWQWAGGSEDWQQTYVPPEPSIVMLVLRAGLKIETFTALDPGLVSAKRQGLMQWRHSATNVTNGTALQPGVTAPQSRKAAKSERIRASMAGRRHNE